MPQQLQVCVAICMYIICLVSHFTLVTDSDMRPSTSSANEPVPGPSSVPETPRASSTPLHTSDCPIWVGSQVASESTLQASFASTA